MPSESKTDSSDLHNIQGVSRRHVTARTLGVAGLIVVSLLCGAVLNFIPAKLLAVLLAAPVGLTVVFLILRNPVVGVYLYYLVEFIRPQEIIPALRAVKISLVIEIITLAAWALHHAKSKHPFYWHRFNWVFLGFVGVLGLSSLTAVNTRWAFDTFRVILVIFTIFVFSTNLIYNLNRLNSLIWVILAAHSFLAIQGLMGGGRIAGSSIMGDENEFALSLNFIIPFAFFIFQDARNRILKGIALVMLTLFVLAVIASMSRGGWVGLVVVFAFCTFRSRRPLATIALILFLGVSVAAFAPSKYWEEVQTIFDTKEATAEARINFWIAAWEMYKDYPILGVVGLKGGSMMPGYITGFDDPNTQWGRTFHGTLPQVMAETGTAGLVLYLTMVYLAVSYLRKMMSKRYYPIDNRYRTFANAIMGSILGFFVSAVFLSSAYAPQLWVLYILTFCLVRCAGDHDAEIADAKNSGNRPAITGV